jgi:hypothetical protein
VSVQDGRRYFGGESASAVLKYIMGLEEKTEQTKLHININNRLIGRAYQQFLALASFSL